MKRLAPMSTQFHFVEKQDNILLNFWSGRILTVDDTTGCLYLSQKDAPHNRVRHKMALRSAKTWPHYNGKYTCQIVWHDTAKLVVVIKGYCAPFSHQDVVRASMAVERFADAKDTSLTDDFIGLPVAGAAWNHGAIIRAPQVQGDEGGEVIWVLRASSVETLDAIIHSLTQHMNAMKVLLQERIV